MTIKENLEELDRKITEAGCQKWQKKRRYHTRRRE